MTDLMKARVLAAAFVGLWAIVESLATHVLRHYSGFQVVWTRYGVHLLFMLLVWGARAPASLIATRRPVFQLARSMLMLGMPAAFILAADRGTPPATIMAIFWLAPLMLLAFAAAGLAERPDRTTWLLSGLGFFGAFIVYRPAALPGLVSLVLALVMGITFSLYVVMTRSLRSEPTRVNLFYTALGVFVVLTPLMPFVWITPPLHDMAILVAIGLLGFVTLWALDRMAAAAPVSLTAPVLYLQVVFTVLLSITAGHWGAGRGTIVGIACIALAVGLTLVSVRRPIVAEAA